jgi:hypothetical protein
MAQTFHRSTNTIARLSIFGGVFAIGLLGWFGWLLTNSYYATDAERAREQPVPFSHKHHVSDDGIDCRYCHTSVEDSSFAGVPATKICMNCHTQIWATSEVLEPVRASFRTGKSLEWTRVYDLPDFVYFNHSIHIHKGIGCVSCHGRVDQMPLTRKVNSLYMRWCLECHRQPERYLRPREHVFDMAWQPPGDQLALGRKLAREYNIRKDLTDCYVCHR